MRPITLEMTAFGSYKNKTEVSFDSLGSGIYLITGDTGAGKSTVFNGVLFALYGKDGFEKKKQETLHSDHADRSEDTVVRLTFEASGKVHSIERRIHFSRSRETGTYDKVSYPSSLSENGKAPITGTEEIKERVRVLVGLDSDRFRHIVMLAQGEFRRFLEANSEKKTEILSQLFDNRIYEVFGDSFIEARKILDRDIAAKRNRIDENMREFILPDDLSEEEMNKFDQANPLFAESVKRQTEENRKAAEAAEKEKNALSERMNELIKKEAEAKAVNEKIAARDAAEKRLSELLGQKGEVDAAEKNKLIFEKAFRNVLPLKNELKKLERESAEAAERLEQLSAEKTSIEKRVLLCAKEYDSCTEYEKKLENELRPSAKKLRESIPEYDEYKDLIRDLAQFLDTSKTLEQFNARSEENIKKLNDERERLSENIAAFEGSAEKAAEAEKQYDSLTRTANDIKALGKELLRLKSSRRDMAARQDELSAVLRECDRKNRIYSSLYEGFIGGQAALLGRRLREDIEKNGRGICPVCHTEFSDISRSFADAAENIPEEREVKAAENDWSKADKKRQELTAMLEGMKKEQDEISSSLMKKASEIFKGKEMTEDILTEGYLSERIKVLSDEAEKYRQKREKYLSEKEEQTKLGKRLKDNDKALETERAKLKEIWADMTEVNETTASLKARYEEKKAHLEFPSKEKAEEQLSRLEKLIAEYEKKLKQAKEAYDRVREEFSKNEGEISANRENSRRLAEKISESREAYLLAIKSSDFTDEADSDRALCICGDAEGEGWIRSEEQRISEFGKKLHFAEGELEKCRKAAEGLVPVETDFRTEENNIKALTEEADRRLALANKVYINNSGIKSRVMSILSELDRDCRAYERVLGIAEAASPSKGVKLPFDSYVIGSKFREILYYANLRLTQVSGGRYELRHKEPDYSGRGNVGLDLELMDYNTGRCRSAGSLSGGEGFTASLSLALGLSDTVRNHAGNVQMESMFIDEGFGTLDDGLLDKTIGILENLAGDDCQIGIISHVDKLRSSIPKQMIIKSGRNGSSLEIISG